MPRLVAKEQDSEERNREVGGNERGHVESVDCEKQTVSNTLLTLPDLGFDLLKDVKPPKMMTTTQTTIPSERQ